MTLKWRAYTWLLPDPPLFELAGLFNSQTGELGYRDHLRCIKAVPCTRMTLPTEVLRNEDGGDEFSLETLYGQHRRHLNSSSM